MIRRRIRIRFRKEGDLRLISHRDLVRTFERLFRRAGLLLSLSEGFHPKARMTFPSALALGIAGRDEVMEFEVAEVLPPEQLHARLMAQAPAGLAITDLRCLEPGERKAHVRQVTYELPIPEPRRAELLASIARLRAEPEHWIARDERPEPIDLKSLLDHLEYCDGALHFRLHADRPVGVRPREVLAALGIADLEQAGGYLTRSRVDLASCPHVNSSVEKNPHHAQGNADQCLAAGRVPDCDH